MFFAWFKKPYLNKVNSNKENFFVPRLIICKVIDYRVQKVANSRAKIDANLASH